VHCISLSFPMSRPQEDDRPIFEGPRQVNTPDSRLKDFSPDDLEAWEALSVKPTPGVEKAVEKAMEEARIAAQNVIAEPAEPVPSIEDLAGLGEVNQGSPSGRLPRQQWGSGMGLNS
jgi:hypothetical protein